MKVLFAMGNEQISKNVATRYYEKFGEELEYKNVFYFKALLDEVKSNKTYDRIVISEELEQFQLKNIESLDKFLFSNIDSVTDEIEDSEIIFICSDRRAKENDKFVERLFNIGVYNILIAEERNVPTLCEYIKNPMNKKEAKRHLNINPVVSNGAISTRDDEVEEVQIMNILKYYDGIRGKVDEYVPAFDRIAEQYSRNQLKVILEFLPPDVKREILSSTKYMYLGDGNQIQNSRNNVTRESKTVINKPTKKSLFGILKENKTKETMQKQPHVIVDENSNANLAALRAQKEREVKEKEQAILKAEQEMKAKEQALLKAQAEKEARAKEQAELKARAEQEALAREQAELRARAEQEVREREQAELRARAEQEAREREQAELRAKAEQEAREREQAELRAKAEQEAQVKEQVDSDDIQVDVMLGINAMNAKAEQEAREREQAELKARAEQEAIAREQAELKARAEQEAIAREQAELKARAEQEALAKQQLELKTKEERESKKKMEQDRLEEERRKLEQEKLALEEEKRKLREQTQQLSKMPETTSIARNQASNQRDDNVKIDYKKMVVFVGANKSGTTFMVNAVSHKLADTKVSVGVLDMTRDKSLYYIYNQDDKDLRKIASECMQKLSEGVDSYIPVSRNLKVYTTIPGPTADTRRSYKNRAIIDNLKDFNNLVLVDADFSTPLEYYEKADEIYIIQDLDIMKMQETTLFLRELKNRSVNMSKIKVIINKYVKSKLTPKKLIEGLSYYNDPQMSFVDELLGSKIENYIVPFNIENYAKYIDGMYSNDLDYKKYSADFLDAINTISNNVYKRPGKAKKRGFFGK